MYVASWYVPHQKKKKNFTFWVSFPKCVFWKQNFLQIMFFSSYKIQNLDFTFSKNIFYLPIEIPNGHKKQKAPFLQTPKKMKKKNGPNWARNRSISGLSIHGIGLGPCLSNWFIKFKKSNVYIHVGSDWHS